MSASLLASFFIFISTGIYALSVQNFPNKTITYIVFGTMIFAGCYYFYVEMYTETSESLKNKLQGTNRIEWVIRCSNQVILLLLWFCLEKDLTIFFIGFISLYATYIFWDMVTWELFDKHGLAVLDVIGFVITTGLFFVVRAYNLEILNSEKNEPHDMSMIIFLMGALCVIYLIIGIVGIFIIKFNPFNGIYWSRKSLH